MQQSNFKMTNQSQGIQQLLAAEKKAADKVGEARKRTYSIKNIRNFHSCQRSTIMRSHMIAGKNFSKTTYLHFGASDSFFSTSSVTVHIDVNSFIPKLYIQNKYVASNKNSNKWFSIRLNFAPLSLPCARITRFLSYVIVLATILP